MPDFNEAKCFLGFFFFFYSSGVKDLLRLLCFCRWVAFEKPGFSGEPYILEKGLYASPEDWGASSHKMSSIQPILHVRMVTKWTHVRLDKTDVNVPVFHIGHADGKKQT